MNRIRVYIEQERVWKGRRLEKQNRYKYAQTSYKDTAAGLIQKKVVASAASPHQVLSYITLKSYTVLLAIKLSIGKDA